MPDTLHLPPDTPDRQPVNYWLNQYDTPVPPKTDTPAAGNYPAWLGRLVAGFMQAKPPTVEGTDDPGDVAQVIDVLDEAAEKAPALSVAYLRPVNTGEVWETQVIDPANVHGVWQHRRLASAIVWRLIPDPAQPDEPLKRLAIVERWGIDADGQQIDAPTVEFWQGDLDTRGRFAGKKMYTADTLPDGWADVPAIAGAIEDANDLTPRELVPFVWRFHRGMPVPIYYREEQFVAGLVRLANQDQTNAEKVKKQVLVDERLIRPSPFTDTNNQRMGGVGWGSTLNRDVYALAAQDGVQNMDERKPVHIVDFADDLTLIERLEHRENMLLERVGIAPQSIGRSVSGRSDSAAAKRADSQLTLTTIGNPARQLSAALTRAFTQTATLNDQGLVVVIVHEGLRPARSEELDEAVKLAQNDIASAETILRTAFPDRDEPWYAAELARLQNEGLARSAMEGLGAFVPDSPASMM